MRALRLNYVTLYRRSDSPALFLQVHLPDHARSRFLLDPRAAALGFKTDRRGRLRHSLGPVALDDARELAKDFDTRAGAAVRGDPIEQTIQSTMTLADLFAWADDQETSRVQSGRLMADTCKANRDRRAQLIRFLAHCGFAKTILLSAIDASRVHGFMSWYMDHELYSAASWNALRGHLSGLWHQAAKFKWVADNPFDDRSLAADEPEPTHAPPLTVDMAHRLYALPPAEDADEILFMLLTGARVSDTVSIAMTQVDRAAGLIRCKQPKLRHQRRQTKLLIITDELAPVIDRQFARHTGSSWLFPRADGERATRKYAKNLLNRRIKSVLDNKFVSTKSCRVTFETRLREHPGISQGIIDELMGHFTGHPREHYAVHELTALRRAAQLGVTEGIFGGEKPQYSPAVVPFATNGTAQPA